MATLNLSPKGIRTAADGAGTASTANAVSIAQVVNSAPYTVFINDNPESLNHIEVAISLLDYLGATVLGAEELQVELLDANMDPASPLSYPITLGSGARGTVDATGSMSSIVKVTTDAATGFIDLDIEDGLIGSNANFYIRVTPFVRGTAAEIAQITFDA